MYCKLPSSLFMVDLSDVFIPSLSYIFFHSDCSFFRFCTFCYAIFYLLCMPVTFVLQFLVPEHFSLNHSSFVCFYLIQTFLFNIIYAVTSVMLSVVSLSLIENFTLFFFHSLLTKLFSFH